VKTGGEAGAASGSGGVSRIGRVGAVLFVLWGLLHVLGGASLLATWRADGAAELMRAYGSSVAGTIPADLPAVVGAIGAFHAFNLLWIGALVTGLAVTWGWKGRAAGLWLSLILAGAADLGLVLFLLLPGHMPWAEGAPGLVLFVPAALCSLLGLIASGPVSRRTRTSSAPARSR